MNVKALTKNDDIKKEELKRGADSVVTKNKRIETGCSVWSKKMNEKGTVISYDGNKAEVRFESGFIKKYIVNMAMQNGELVIL